MRIATRYDVTEPFSGLMGVLHEVGQAMYDLGLPAAWAVSRTVKSMLFGLTPTDPASVATAAVLLVVDISSAHRTDQCT